MRKMTDEKLTILAQQGENRAFDILLGRYRHYIYKYLMRLIADPDAVEDIIQDTYLKVFKSIHQYRAEASFKSWLFVIVRNTWKNHLRSQNYLNRIDQFQDVYDLSMASEESIEKEVMYQEESTQVQKAIATLPNKQRKTVFMRINKQLPFTEIAEAMQCSVSTAKANHYYGMKAVGQMMVA